MYGESRSILWHTTSVKAEPIFLKFPWFILRGISASVILLSDDRFLVQASEQAGPE